MLLLFLMAVLLLLLHLFSLFAGAGGLLGQLQLAHHSFSRTNSPICFKIDSIRERKGSDLLVTPSSTSVVCVVF